MDLDRLAKQLKLTATMRHFAEAMVEARALDPMGRHGAEVCRRLGIGKKDPCSAAKRLMASPKVKLYMEALVAAAGDVAAKRTEQVKMTAAEVLERLSVQARASLQPHLRFGAEGENPTVLVSEAHCDNIREFTVETKDHGSGEAAHTVTRTKIRVADPVPSLVAIAKIMGLEDLAAKEASNEWKTIRERMREILKDPARRRALEAVAEAAYSDLWGECPAASEGSGNE